MLIPPALEVPPPAPEVPAWFRTQGGPRLESLGEVSFARLGTPYVAETFYVDGEALRRLGLRGRAPIWEAVARGRVASACRIRFLVNLGAERRRTFFSHSLARTWPDSGFSLDRKEVQAFLRLVCRPMEPGDRQDYLFLPEKGLWVRMGDEAPVRFAPGPLVEAIRRIEWEEDGENPGTMTGLLQRYADRQP